MEEENITSETLSEDLDVESADGDEAVENVTPKEGSSIAQTLSDVLGKEFKDDDSALKAVKDTFSYVGKKEEAIRKEVAEELTAKQAVDAVSGEVKALSKELFYSKNPQYEPMRKVIEKMGANPSEVVATEEFKTVFDKVKGYEDLQATKNVLESNPRIGQARNRIADAKEAAQKGNFDAAEKSAVAAVVEAYDM